MRSITVLVDTNIPLDSFSKRGLFRQNAEKILNLCGECKCKGFIAAHSITNIFYILRKEFTAEKRKEMLLELCNVVEIVGIDKAKLLEALLDDTFDDIEDRLQAECAEAVNADYIITRDPGGFVHSSVPVISPEAFLKLMENKEVHA